MEWKKRHTKVKVLSFGQKKFYFLGKDLSYEITNYLNFLKGVLYSIQCLTFMLLHCNKNVGIIVFCLILLFYSYVYIYYYLCVCSIKDFSACSLVGLVVLLPLNYGVQEVQNGNYFSMVIFVTPQIRVSRIIIKVKYFKILLTRRIVPIKSLDIQILRNSIKVLTSTKNIIHLQNSKIYKITKK
ncbi:hypothetical protein V8G54_032383 [Vigna mungo]|uniref:Uncharacterized protein n=1 Tax=Vigna mungo TaxID=3915 RepID=A0AAQ3RIS5_VIGMU